MISSKERVISILSSLKNNFDYDSVEDYINFILFFEKCISSGETDNDILGVIYEIINNIKGKHSTHEDTKQYLNLIHKTEDLYYELPDTTKEILSYRVLCPQAKKRGQ